MLDLGPTLAATLAPLIPRCGGSVQRAAETAARAGLRAVQLSAAQKDMRPRDLDRRARREVLAMLSRSGLMLAGLDLMIPHKDYLQSATQDRAVGSVLGAIDLAAELGRVPLSLSLPVEKLPQDVTDALLTAADGHGVTLAVHAEHDLDALEKWLATHDLPVVRIGLDPATLLALDHDPAAVAVRFAAKLAVARLDDHATTSTASAGGRVPVGEGDLELLPYRGALAVATKLRSVVVELRDLPDPVAGMRVAQRKWEEVVMP